MRTSLDNKNNTRASADTILHYSLEICRVYIKYQRDNNLGLGIVRCHFLGVTLAGETASLSR